MNRIKLKYTEELKVEKNDLDRYNNSLEDTNKEFSQNVIGKTKIPSNVASAWLFGKESVTIAHVLHTNNDKIIICEPNFTILNFEAAVRYNELIQANKKEFLSKVSINQILKSDIDDVKNTTFDYFIFVNGFIISLFTALECFVNTQIDDSLDDYNQILRYTTFHEKITKYLNTKIKKDFSKLYSSEWNYILNLKQVRDSIVHLKPKKQDNLNYKEPIRSSIKIDYDKTLIAVKKFINFHCPNLIEEITPSV